MTLLHLDDMVLNADWILRACYDASQVNHRLEITVQVDAQSPTNIVTMRGSAADAMWHTLTALAVDVQADYDIHMQEQEAQHDHLLFDRGTPVHPDILRNQGWQRALANFIRQGGIHTGYQYVQLNDAGGYSYHDEMPASADLSFCVMLDIPYNTAETTNPEARMWEQLHEQILRRTAGQ